MSYLTEVEQKADIQPTTMHPRIQGSPVKSQLINRLDDYNDSGYGGSPLPPGRYKCAIWMIHMLNLVVQAEVPRRCLSFWEKLCSLSFYRRLFLSNVLHKCKYLKFADFGTINRHRQIKNDANILVKRTVGLNYKKRKKS